MEAHTDADDGSNSEYTDAEIEAVVEDLYDLCDDVTTLDRHVSQIYADQLDGIAGYDSAEVTLFTDTEHGTHTANIIQAVLDSDVGVVLESTAPGHEHVTFRVDA